MSRIIVKQLPKNISEEKVRNIFGSKGSITDIQLKYTSDGKFRQFCFIGYQTEEEAQNAIKHFHNTCVQTSRIKVETCAALGSEDKPQSWSKYAKDSKRNPEVIKAEEEKWLAERELKAQAKTQKKSKKLDEIVGDHKDDPDFVEFMQAHDKNRALWANDAAQQEELTETNAAEENANKSKSKTKKSENNVENKVKEVKDAMQDNNVVDAGDDSDEHVDYNENNGSENDENEKLAAKPISDLEYMKSLMSSNNKTKTTLEGTKSKHNKKSDKNKEKINAASSPASDLDLFTIKIHNVPYKTKRQEILKFFKPLKPYSVRLPSKVHGFCYVGFKTEKEMTKAMLKDKSFIKGKQVFFSDFTEKNKITKSKLNGSGDAGQTANATGKMTGNAKWHQQEANLRNEENISESGCIFFRNLPYTTTEDELQQVFEKFGPITEIHLPVDLVTRQIKGFGTVTFVMPEHAMLAFNKLDGTDFHGRLLHLIPGKSKETNEETNENDENLTFQQKKTIKMKKQAQQSSTWNTLFLGANAVAELLSKQFNMSKEQILDTSEGGSSAAVRLALGETQIVVEMKQFLEEHGVRLSAFDAGQSKIKRSKTIILAKNLPADTQIEELTPLFAKFGPIGRFVLPPSGVTALIEFCDPSEARQAFKKLAFSKFKTLPLFLEWAPEHVFTTTLQGEPTIPKVEEQPKPSKKEAESTEQQQQKDEIVSSNEKEINDEEEKPEDADDEPEANTTLFLRNLNFKTVLDTVRQHFKHLGTIHTVEIAKRKDPENPRQMNSLGYGFIQFKKSAIAETALKTMQLTFIDGNQVELKRSDRILKSGYNNDAGAQRKQTKLTKQNGTKILVRNIPFQANHKEVRDIFKAFGELRSLRLPRKMTPGEDAHRGFGFVDYMTKSDAKKAFEAVSASTHLYGRRLVLEWASASDEENIEELRKRTAVQFYASKDASEAKRSKRAVFDMEGNMQHIKMSANNDDDGDDDDDDDE